MRIKGTSLTTVVLASSLAVSAEAADHVDSPAAIAEPAADITDVFAWTSNGGAKVNLAFNVVAAAFSDRVQYVLHVESSAGFGMAGTAMNIICTFDAAQRVSCWAGNEYVTGDASAAQGIASGSGALRVFAGRRDDPFYFNLNGFGATIAIVKGAAPSLTFDPAGCPALDAATSAALVAQLRTKSDGTPGRNDFMGLDVSTLLVQVDKALVTSGGSTLAVWASTHAAQ